jgi:hypothetical protein
MATISEIKKNIYKPGDEVPTSGIYQVVHDTVHNEEHEVTAVVGEPFPPCNHCGQHPRFRLVHAAHHIQRHEFFK